MRAPAAAPSALRALRSYLLEQRVRSQLEQLAPALLPIHTMVAWPAAASGPTFYYSDLAAAEAFYLTELGLTAVSRSAHRVVRYLIRRRIVLLAFDGLCIRCPYRRYMHFAC